MSILVQRFANREDWLRERILGVGSSDAAVILGVSPYKSPFVLYQEKKGAQDVSSGEREALWWGVTLEEPIARRYEKETERIVRHNSTAEMHQRTDSGFDWARATIDATILPGPANPPEHLEDDGVLEIKNVSNYVGERWRDRPPIEFIVQLQHQMFVTGRKWGSIAALIGGNTFRYADVERDEEMIELMVRAEQDFLRRLELNDPPPADESDHTKELLRRLYPKDKGTTVTLDVDAIEWDADYVRGGELEKEGAKLKQRAQNLFRAALTDASFGVLPNGVRYSNKAQHRGAYSVAEADFRVLRRHGTKGPKATNVAMIADDEDF